MRPSGERSGAARMNRGLIPASARVRHRVVSVQPVPPQGVIAEAYQITADADMRVCTNQSDAECECFISRSQNVARSDVQAK